MKRIWNGISHVGTCGDLQGNDIRNIIFLNRICAIMCVFILSSVFINLILGSTVFIPVLSAALVVFSATYFFHAYKIYFAAKLTLIIATLALLTYMSISGGAGSGLEFYFLSLTVLPAILIRNQKLVFLFQALCIAALIFQKFYTDAYPQKFDEPIIFQVFYVVNSTYSCVLIALALAFFKTLHKKAEAQISNSSQVIETKNSELEHAIAMLKTSEERFRLIAENSTDIISRHTADGRFLYVSPSIKSLLGYTPHEVNGQLPEDFIYPEDISIFRDAYQKILTQEGINTICMRFSHKDGRYLWVESTIKRVLTEGKMEIHATTRDVSERKHAERELVEKNRDLEQFAYVASHDLKEPLRMISSYTNLLARKIPVEDIDAREFSNYVLEGATRMQSLINDLLRYG
nr:PAS domain S-box protein [Bacteroidota bacterium]